MSAELKKTNAGAQTGRRRMRTQVFVAAGIVDGHRLRLVFEQEQCSVDTVAFRRGRPRALESSGSEAFA